MTTPGHVLGPSGANDQKLVEPLESPYPHMAFFLDKDSHRAHNQKPRGCSGRLNFQHRLVAPLLHQSARSLYLSYRDPASVRVRPNPAVAFWKSFQSSPSAALSFW
jgi:hypothetical protein